MEKDKRPITERVTCWDDVLRELGENHPYVKELQELEQHAFKKDEFLINAHKLRIVCEVLNEGWRPDFHEGEYRFYPWFYLYKTKEDADKYANDDECVFEIPEPLRACLWGGDAHYGSTAGLGYATTLTVPSNANAYIASRLYLKTRELALHAGKCFNELWLKYLLC